MPTHLTDSEGATAAVGRALARDLQPGQAVLLEGPLGSGKTAFVRGLAEGLGCDGDDVSSPTFTIIQEYRGARRLQHVDLYRLAPKEVADLGLDELLEDSVIAVEWAERWQDAPTNAVHVRIESLGGTRRKVTIEKT
jgi:tRNA threonylcarbamoyladenosine biosynthesis protein TsaE